MEYMTFDEFNKKRKDSIDWCNKQIIHWRLIGTITNNLELLSDAGKRELGYALDLLATCEYWGLTKKAAYIRRRIRDKSNYIEGR